MIKEEIINNLIQREKVDTNLITDGFHTFGELYEHRITLFIALARALVHARTLKYIWRFKTDDNWFLLGINKREGEQITYHLPISKWDQTEFADTVSARPLYDGHTSQDVLDRLNKLI